MGNTVGMGQTSHSVTLYTCQRKEVVDILHEEGVYFVKECFIREKYGEVAPLFLAAYQWYKGRAHQYAPRPPQSESAVWAFLDRNDVAGFDGYSILTLQVPVEEAVLFDMLDWTEILNLRYLGSEEERYAFQDKLRAQGVEDPAEVMTTPFYPLLKRELQSSWNNLFRHDEMIKSGETSPVGHIQAGLWQIKREWVVHIQ